MKKILASIICIAMVLVTMSITVFADEKVAAKIGDKEYETLAAAIEAAAVNDEIDLCVDVEQIPTITKAITIDGNNCHVTAKAKEHQFTVIEGTVTLKNLVYDNGTEAIRTDYGNYGGETDDYENLDLVIEGCTFNDLNGYAIMGGQTTTKKLKSLTVSKCTFNAGTECDNYMVYAQQVGTLTITDCTFNGEGVTKGAIHTGDSTETATVATISGGKISGVERGVQICNRVDGSSVSVNDVAFDGVTAAEGEKTGALYVYNYATTPVSATNNTFDNCTNIVSTNNTTEGFVSTIVTTFTGNTADDKEVVLNSDGTVTESAPAVNAVAKIGDVEYATLEEAITAAQSGDVIDLMGNAIEFTETNNCIGIEGDITIQNGTIDLNDAVFNGNSIFYIGSGDKVTFKNVDFKGDGYSSAYGVIYTEGGEIVVEDCNFELKNEKFSAGAVIKGNNPAVDKATIKNCTFNLENPCSVMRNITIDMADTTINAEITDTTLVAGELKNHAFRNIYGTISNSTITAKGFESGIKNTESQALTVEGTSVITLKENDADLVVTSNTTLDVSDTSVVSTQTALADDNTTVTCDGNAVSGTQKSSGAVTSGSTEQKWCAYKFEITPTGNSITVKVASEKGELTSEPKAIANIDNTTTAIIGVTATGVDNLASITVTTAE